jgi:hypothetical protein
MMDDEVLQLYSNNRIRVVHGVALTPHTFNFHIATFNRADVDFVNVSGQGFLGTGSYYFRTRSIRFGRPPDIIKQGDEGDYNRKIIKGLGVSAGYVYRTKSTETNIQWDRNSKILGMDSKLLRGCYNATGGSNILVENGEIHWSVLDDPHEDDPRSVIGWNDETYYLVVIDGRNNGTLGLSKKETAEFMLSIGCTNAHNSDGGDSNQLMVNDNGKPKIINNLVQGYEHQLIQYVGFWLKPISVKEKTHES